MSHGCLTISLCLVSACLQSWNFFFTVGNVALFLDLLFLCDTGKSTLEQLKVLMNNISGQILCKLHIDMKMNYSSGLSIHGFWETIFYSNWPGHLR
jgi:hypothetical protein